MAAHVHITPISPPNLADLEPGALEAMADAGERVLDAYRVLHKSNTNVVAEVLRGVKTFYQWDHYPENDVYDWETHSQYFYHAHPPEDRSGPWTQEHGHFHTFLRPKGMPADVRPAAVDEGGAPAKPEDALSHLFAISMDKSGYPVRLFTVNRWVTGETWYHADDVIRMLDRFSVDQALPSWPVNVWITNLLRLYRPTVEALVRARDAAIAAALADGARDGARKPSSRRRGASIYDDPSLEVTSYIDIDVDGQIAALNDALAASGGRRIAPA